MPFSNPSYFGPARNLDRIVGQNAGLLQTGNRVFLAGLNAGRSSSLNDIIVIGSSALDAGGGSANGDGTIAIGSNALSAATTYNADSPNVAIGQDVAANMVEAYGMVIIGERALAGPVGTDPARDSFESVIIGAQAAYSTNAGFNVSGNWKRSVVIGYQADMRTVTGASTDREDSVIIGYQAHMNAVKDGSSGLDGVVAIGYQANMNGKASASVIIGQSASSTTAAGGASANETIIGNQAAAQAGNSSDNVIIGATATANGSRNIVVGSGAESGTATDSVIIGHAALAANTQAGALNVVIGAYTTVGSGTASGAARNILIGYGAAVGATASDIFAIENTDGASGGGTRRRVFRGVIGSGNIIIGNVPDADINWRGTTQPTNAVKLINGTVGTGTNPSNGGFFYVDAGVLHWFDQSGIDMSLSVPVAGQLASTSIGYTDGAAAAAGTLTNAPAAGDPTKWIPINDNGTIRYIPAW